MARASRLLAVSCCLAEISSYLMCGLRSRLKRSPAYVMLTFPRLLAFSLLLCSTALNKMCAASNDALVQRTLHPLKIPRKSSTGPVKAGSLSASSADRGGTSPVVPRSQKQASTAPPLPLPSRARRDGDTKVRRPFRRLRPLRWQTKRCREKVLLSGFRLCCGWGVACQRCEGTGKLLEPNPGCCLS